MATEWYRRQSWTDADQKEFFTQLGRARKDGRAQYLKLQAYALLDTEDSTLIAAAESLLATILTDYPDDRVEKSSTLKALGDIFDKRGDKQKALDYYKHAIEFEEQFPNVISGAHLDFAKIVVQTGQTDLYDEVEARLLSELTSGGVMFPAELYIIGSILSVIFSSKGDPRRAKHYAELAAVNAKAKANTLWNPKKQSYGLVEEREHWLDMLVNEGLEERP